MIYYVVYAIYEPYYVRIKDLRRRQVMIFPSTVTSFCCSSVSSLCSSRWLWLPWSNHNVKIGESQGAVKLGHDKNHGLLLRKIPFMVSAPWKAKHKNIRETRQNLPVSSDDFWWADVSHCNLLALKPRCVFLIYQKIQRSTYEIYDKQTNTLFYRLDCP